MENRKFYRERSNRTQKLYNIAVQILKPILKIPKASLLYTIHKNWGEMIGKEFIDYTKVERVALARNQKIANLYVISFNSAVSFYINNNKSYILDRINNFFGYRAVTDLYVKEIPRIVLKSAPKYEINEEKLAKFIETNDIGNDALREKLNELAKEVYKSQLDL
jgi:hypothetical protein